MGGVIRTRINCNASRRTPLKGSHYIINKSETKHTMVKRRTHVASRKVPWMCVAVYNYEQNRVIKNLTFQLVLLVV